MDNPVLSTAPLGDCQGLNEHTGSLYNSIFILTNYSEHLNVHVLSRMTFDFKEPQETPAPL